MKTITTILLSIALCAVTGLACGSNALAVIEHDGTYYVAKLKKDGSSQPVINGKGFTIQTTKAKEAPYTETATLSKEGKKVVAVEVKALDRCLNSDVAYYTNPENRKAVYRAIEVAALFLLNEEGGTFEIDKVRFTFRPGVLRRIEELGYSIDLDRAKITRKGQTFDLTGWDSEYGKNVSVDARLTEKGVVFICVDRKGTEDFEILPNGETRSQRINN